MERNEKLIICVLWALWGCKSKLHPHQITCISFFFFFFFSRVGRGIISSKRFLSCSFPFFHLTQNSRQKPKPISQLDILMLESIDILMIDKHQFTNYITRLYIQLLNILSILFMYYSWTLLFFLDFFFKKPFFHTTHLIWISCHSGVIIEITPILQLICTIISIANSSSVKHNQILGWTPYVFFGVRKMQQYPHTTTKTADI